MDSAKRSPDWRTIGRPLKSRIVLQLDRAFQIFAMVLALLFASFGLIEVIKGGGWKHWLVLLFFGFCALIVLHDLLIQAGFLKHRIKSREPPHKVEVSEKGVVSYHASGTVERVSWDALELVALRAEYSYPMTDVYWILLGANETGCVVPIDAEGNEALLAALQQRLPEFDNDAVIEVMGQVEGGREVWRRGERSPG